MIELLLAAVAGHHNRGIGVVGLEHFNDSCCHGAATDRAENGRDMTDSQISAKHAKALDQDDTCALLCRRDGGTKSCGTAADHGNVIGAAHCNIFLIHDCFHKKPHSVL